MAITDNSAEPALRFKRRKVAHTKRAPLHNEVTTTSPERSPNATPIEAAVQQATLEEDESAPNLREILRSRKRPRDRIREATRKPEPVQSQALVVADAPKQDLYATRFVAQTGQVVDRDDKQM
jgi:hypothetical protein